MKQVAVVLRAVLAEGRWRRSLAVVVLFALACAGLSWWQFSRRDETAAANARLAANWTAPALPIAELLPAGDAWRPSVEWRTAALRGRYLPAERLLVRNRPRDGRPGYEVLVPFRLDGGRILVVDRGWVPIGTRQELPDVVPAPPADAVAVEVRLRPSERIPSGRTSPPGQIAAVDAAAVAAQSGTGAVYRGAYGLLRSESPAPSVMPAPFERPSFDEGTHLSYALQWIAFAVMAFCGLGWSVRRDLRDAGDPHVAAADARAAVRRSRRAPTDETEEDALVDSRR